MKKTIILLCMVVISTTLYAVPDFIGEWEGSIEGYNFNIVFMHSNMCIITVRTVQDNREIAEDTEGTYSYDEDIIRISGNFPHSKIQNLNQINWTSVYVFNNTDNSAFFMWVTLPDSSKQRISFARIIKWE